MNETYIHLTKIARSLGYSPTTMRAVKAVTAPDLPGIRRKGADGKQRTQLHEIEAVLTWLRRVIPRLTPSQELALRQSTIPLTISNTGESN